MTSVPKPHRTATPARTEDRTWFMRIAPPLSASLCLLSRGGQWDPQSASSVSSLGWTAAVASWWLVLQRSGALGGATEPMKKAIGHFLALALGLGVAGAEDWPEWRGQGRAGVWNEPGIVAELPGG